MPIQALSNKILSLCFFLRVPIPTILFKPTQGVFGATICAHARGQGFESYSNHHFLRHLIKGAFLLACFSHLRRRNGAVFIYIGLREVYKPHKKGPKRAFFSNCQIRRIQLLNKSPYLVYI